MCAVVHGLMVAVLDAVLLSVFKSCCENQSWQNVRRVSDGPSQACIAHNAGCEAVQFMVGLKVTHHTCR